MNNIEEVVKEYSYESLDKHIKSCLKRSAEDLVRAGYMLKTMMNEKKWSGWYSCFDEYLKQELHMDYTAASRFIKACDKYAGGTMELGYQYQSYSQSVLIEMLSMTPEQEAMVTQDMTVKQVREIKKKDKPVKSAESKETIIDGAYKELSGQMSIYDYPGVVPESKKCFHDGSYECNFKNLWETKTQLLLEKCDRTCCYGCQEVCGCRCFNAPLEENKSVATSQQDEAEESDIDFLKNVLEREKDYLNQYLDEQDSKNISKRLIRKQKFVVTALAAMLCDLDQPEIPEPVQPKLPRLKNNDQRGAFIDSYKDWPLWIDEGKTGERYYRYDMGKGASMIVKVYRRHSWENYKKSRKIEYSQEEYYLMGVNVSYGQQVKMQLDPEQTFLESMVNRSALIDYLKEVQKNESK